ncbi:MAG: CDP-alcohol phosphatidyltransferase family protein [Candidatus Helarchaeota archaeon]|nr:CDP-alcohol phosphatidyltransferase family protein [Candidatus Helarchaeota archaeon]
MVLSRLRSISEKILRPAANLAIKLGITPNQATLLGFFVSIIAAGVIFLYPIWPYFLVLCAGLLLLAGYFDALDGAIARNSHQITAFGGFLDSVLDRYADAILIGCIILAGLCVPWIGLIAIIGTLLVSYTRARAEAANGENVGGKKMAVGIAERGERMLLLMAVFALQGIPELTMWVKYPQWGYVGIGIIILAILTHITVIHRIIHALRNLPESPQEPPETEPEDTQEDVVVKSEEIVSAPEAVVRASAATSKKSENIINL